MAARASYSTRPRERISGILQGERRFFTAAEVHRTLAERNVNVSLSTVYRTLEHLRDKGEATVRIDDLGESAYMRCEPETHHHHAICRNCGRVEDVDCAAVEQFAESLRTLHGFALEGHKMEFFGRCKSCA